MNLDTSSQDQGVLSRVEQRGIEPVPSNERNGSPGQLFWVWFAANISILGIPLGATLVALGLNVWQAVLATAIGAFGSFALVGVISIAGRRGGAPSLTLTRSIFGVRGNIGPTLIALLSRLGWETVNTITGASALLSLSVICFGTAAGYKDVPWLTFVCVLIFVALTAVISVAGHSFILTVQKWATWVFGALTLLVVLYLVTTVDWNQLFSGKPGTVSAFIIAVGTIAAGTGIGWVNSGADMARYQKTSVKGSSLILTAAAGAGIPLVVVIGVGSILTAGGSGLASATDPVAAVRSALPAWVSIPYLIAAFAGLLMSNNISVYSAGLTTLTLGIRIPRVYAVTLDILVTTSGAMYFMLGSGGFYGPFVTFISLLAVPLTAWTGVFLVDMMVRKRYDSSALLQLNKESRYWYWHGINVSATMSWLIGLAVGFLFVTAKVSENVTWFSGPLANTVIGRNGLAWLVSLCLAAALYAIFGLPRLLREQTKLPEGR
ncbi:MAG: cytosine permease [Bifidobacterium sp.]|uniref:Cytosine permease n=1 Tax=Bifidobacterium fermentum TaxID=3059035 RepID=A0AB39UA73_9BIFI